MSDYVLSTIQDSFNIRILSSIKDKVIVIDPDPEVVYSGLSFLSIALLGIFGVVVILVATDIYYPDALRFIPFLGDLLDGTYSTCNTIVDWF
jgi:hypothetical protein